MRRLREGFLIVLCLAGMPLLAIAETPPDLPPDFLSTFQSVEAAYARQDVEGIMARYDPHCAFSSTDLHDFHLKQNVADKRSPTKPKVKPVRHDLAFERQRLQAFFTVSRLEANFGSAFDRFPPARNVTVTSHVQQWVLNRKATELHLTVVRKAHLDRGQAQETHNEEDEEVWGKNAQGWQLKRLTTHRKIGWIDYS